VKKIGWRRVLETLATHADTATDHARQRLRKGRPLQRPLVIVPYLGFGTSTQLTLSGRVLEDTGSISSKASDSRWRNLVQFAKHLETDEVPGARVRACWPSGEQDVLTDGEGYFDLEITPAQPLSTPGWQTVELKLLEPAAPCGTPVRAQAQVLVPPPSARFGVISDIDDTIVHSHVKNRLKMLLALARSNAHTRKPFDGVAAFYRALQLGVGGDEQNPIFYVSSSPWNLYTPLVEFLSVQDIPLGPLLLKDFGEHTLFASRDHHSHKRAAIERILQTYASMRFVLIGDSGEQDPEIYAGVVRDHPDRVQVIYIRAVQPDATRTAAIEHLIAEVGRSAAQLVLVPDSEFAAAHAASAGLISVTALSKVRQEKRRARGAASVR
jgi:phosphatidate phosphatase APP1